MNKHWGERWLPILLTGIAGLLFVVVIELALLLSPALPAAHAQIPDSGLQRKETIDAIERTNQRLDELTKLLRTQVFKVRVVAADTDKQSVRSPGKAADAK